MAIPIQKRWNINLVANEKSIQPFMKYYITIKIRGQEKRVEKRCEWER